MKIKLIALALLLMLLVVPVSQVVYAQDTGGDGTDVGTGDGTVDGEDPEDDGQIDPVIYEQIKLQAENRYMELYLLISGHPVTVSDDGGDDGTEDETGDEEVPDYDGPVIPDDVDPALRNHFIHAWSAMQQAQEMGESDPRAAANQYLRAMKQLRNAYIKLQEDNPGAVSYTHLTLPTILLV